MVWKRVTRHCIGGDGGKTDVFFLFSECKKPLETDWKIHFVFVYVKCKLNLNITSKYLLRLPYLNSYMSVTNKQQQIPHTIQIIEEEKKARINYHTQQIDSGAGMKRFGTTESVRWENYTRDLQMKTTRCRQIELINGRMLGMHFMRTQHIHNWKTSAFHFISVQSP